MIKSRSKAIAKIMRALIAQKDASVSVLTKQVPNLRRKLVRWERGETEPTFTAVIDLFTLLRCEVILVPLGEGTQWVVLNKIPYNDGGVLEYPKAVVKRGRQGRRQRYE